MISIKAETIFLFVGFSFFFFSFLNIFALQKILNSEKVERDVGLCLKRVFVTNLADARQLQTGINVLIVNFANKNAKELWIVIDLEYIYIQISTKKKNLIEKT